MRNLFSDTSVEFLMCKVTLETIRKSLNVDMGVSKWRGDNSLSRKCM